MQHLEARRGRVTSFLPVAPQFVQRHEGLRFPPND
jgi:hypothetical protein